MRQTNNTLPTSQEHIEITINQQKVAFQQEDKTLLNCLEKHDVEVHYHCRDGFCGACRIKLNSGQVLYPNGEPLAFVGDDEILPCCCIPITNISIEVD